jgi:uncharacterized protein (DUF4415 family)
MPKLKTGTLIPTEDEDAAITAAALTDPDATPYSDAQWETIKPTVRRGRPLADVTKERITIRLSSDVVRAFRESGDGWQTRINDALADWLKSHRPG